MQQNKKNSHNNTILLHCLPFSTPFRGTTNIDENFLFEEKILKLSSGCSSSGAPPIISTSCTNKAPITLSNLPKNQQWNAEEDDESCNNNHNPQEKLKQQKQVNYIDLEDHQMNKSNTSITIDDDLFQNEDEGGDAEKEMEGELQEADGAAAEAKKGGDDEQKVEEVQKIVVDKNTTTNNTKKCAKKEVQEELLLPASYLISHFRGRKLLGKRIPLPESYTGKVLVIPAKVRKGDADYTSDAEEDIMEVESNKIGLKRKRTTQFLDKFGEERRRGEQQQQNNNDSSNNDNKENLSSNAGANTPGAASGGNGNVKREQEERKEKRCGLGSTLASSPDGAHGPISHLKNTASSSSSSSFDPSLVIEETGSFEEVYLWEHDRLPPPQLSRICEKWLGISAVLHRTEN